jgi:hypothetical protein
MTIVEHAPCSTNYAAQQSITADSSPIEQFVEPAPAPANGQTQPSSRSHRWTVFARRRRYNHPRRERFVEDAAMSREMFRL